MFLKITEPTPFTSAESTAIEAVPFSFVMLFAVADHGMKFRVLLITVPLPALQLSKCQRRVPSFLYIVCVMPRSRFGEKPGEVES